MALWSSSPAIGIDFGTSKCCVAVAVARNQTTIFENEFGQKTTASCVAFTHEERLVGGGASDVAVVHRHSTVHAVKRVLGRFSNEIPSGDFGLGFLPNLNEKNSLNSMEEILCFPQGLSRDNSEVGIQVTYKNEDVVLFPEEIAAALLGKMKSIAETRLNCNVTHCVVAVPAFFNNNQRKAVKTAAKIAGFEKVCLTNAPTAVALDYASISNFNKKERIFVIDFGAGKLDVSLVHLDGETVNVLATSGNVFFGGYDLDLVLVKMCVEKIEEKHNVNLWESRKALMKMLKACKKTKHALSMLPSAPVEIDELLPGVDFKFLVKRQDFEDLYLKKLEKELHRHILRCCIAGKTATAEVDHVLLVGGASRVSGFERILKTHFGGKNLTKTVNMDESIAAGCAISAINKFGNLEKPLTVNEINMHAVDVVPTYSTVSTVVKPGDRLPYMEEKHVELDCFTTLHEHQYNYDWNRSSYSTLGILHKNFDWPRFKNEKKKIKLAITPDDGILRVTLEGKNVTDDSEENLSKMVQRNRNFEKDIVEKTRRDEAMVELEEFCYKMSEKTRNEKIKRKCNETVEWVYENLNATLQEMIQKRKELESSFSREN